MQPKTRYSSGTDQKCTKVPIPFKGQLTLALVCIVLAKSNYREQMRNMDNDVKLHTRARTLPAEPFVY